MTEALLLIAHGLFGVALLVAVPVPDRWIALLLRNRLWLFPVAAMFACT
jgi:hypothetical protein